MVFLWRVVLCAGRSCGHRIPVAHELDTHRIICKASKAEHLYATSSVSMIFCGVRGGGRMNPEAGEFYYIVDIHGHVKMRSCHLPCDWGGAPTPSCICCHSHKEFTSSVQYQFNSCVCLSANAFVRTFVMSEIPAL